MIPILDAADAAPVTLPLWSDPALIAANATHIMSRYLATGDASGLAVPAGCTMVTFRALSALDMAAAEARAGRPAHLGSVLAARKAVARTEAGDLDTSAGATAFARWLDALSDDDAEALDAHDAWVERRNVELAAAAVVAVDDGAQSRGFTEWIAMVASPSLRSSIIFEIGLRVAGVSGLGRRPKACCVSVSGSPRPTKAHDLGAATSAQTPSERPEATAGASPSPTG